MTDRKIEDYAKGKLHGNELEDFQLQLEIDPELQKRVDKFLNDAELLRFNQTLNEIIAEG